MKITLLRVAGCPNAELARTRIMAALAGRAAEVELVEVHDVAEAQRYGMTGSPTILVDGVDPFVPVGAEPSVSCRIQGVPSVAALRQALFGCGCADGDALDMIGRAGRGRRAPAEGGLRAIHQAVLLAFCATGAAPSTERLDSIAATYDRTAGEVMAELAREDFLTLDDAGRIRAAYPFSAVPTRHRVKIDDGAQAWSMCAIDALGIPAMVGRDVTISSVDPVNGQPVVITVTAGMMDSQPSGAVVFAGMVSGEGPSADTCCGSLNFFTDKESARTWAQRHPHVSGQIVSLTRAEAAGRAIFGPLLQP